MKVCVRDWIFGGVADNVRDAAKNLLDPIGILGDKSLAQSSLSHLASFNETLPLPNSAASTEAGTDCLLSPPKCGFPWLTGSQHAGRNSYSRSPPGLWPCNGVISRSDQGPTVLHSSVSPQVAGSGNSEVQRYPIRLRSCQPCTAEDKSARLQAAQRVGYGQDCCGLQHISPALGDDEAWRQLCTRYVLLL